MAPRRIIKVDTAPLARFVASVRRRALDVAIRRAGQLHLSLIQQAFATRGVDPETGVPGVWPLKVTPDPSLAPNPRSRRRRFDPTPRLQDTGRLLGGIRVQSAPGGYEIGPEPLAYAPVHQYGATIPISAAMRGKLRAMGFRVSNRKAAVTIPARPYIVMPRPWQTLIADAAAQAIAEEAARAATAG